MISILFLSFRLALTQVKRSPLRASLTVLGILVGIASVVVVTGLARGAQQSVTKQVDALGSNFMMVFPENSHKSGKKVSGLRLSEDDASAIGREALSIRSVAPMISGRVQALSGETNWSTTVNGTTLNFFFIRSWKLATGALWEASDEATKTRVCVLGASLAERLFHGADPVGREIRIGRHNFKVLGVLERKGQGGIGGDQDDLVVMPLGSVRSRLVRTQPGGIHYMIMSATSGDTIDRATKQITAILRQRHELKDADVNDFRIRTQEEFRAFQDTILNVLSMLLLFLASVSLLVGGIGVMNIMLASIRERTREIGIRMALGARSSAVQLQFLTEATVLAMFGGVLGLLLGLGANIGVGKLLDWDMSPPAFAVALSLGVSAAIGVAFGFFPARRASLLDPIRALRQE